MAALAVAVPQVAGNFDVIFLLAYPFSDHPSFPEGILKRYLELHGFSVGIIETPFWQKSESFAVLGKPNLFFAIIPGPVDSVVLNYTSTKKRRNEDLYQLNNEAFFSGYPPSIKYKKRPDLVSVVFANKIRETYKNTPVIIGGVEASQRTFSHFDFQREKIKRSILFDSRADILVNGMGEKQILEIANKINSGIEISDIEIDGTSKIVKDISKYKNAIILPEHPELEKKTEKLIQLEKSLAEAKNKNRIAVQKVDNRFVIKYPSIEYNKKDIDLIYGLDYTRTHPINKGYSHALNMNLFSITSHRGCGGGCSFCSISSHEGKKVISRSVESILKEINSLKNHPKWRGVISDVGGASAESYGTDCKLVCSKASCMFPQKCTQLKSTKTYRELLKTVRGVSGIKNISIGSGLRYDLLLDNPQLLEDVMRYHTGKFLRVAPEHTEDSVLSLMRKPSWDVFLKFYKLFNSINKNLKRKIDLFPYLIVGFPGETEGDVFEMKKKLRSLKIKTTDAQIFTPTPGTIATALYVSKLSLDNKTITVEQNIKKIQRRKKIITGE